MSSLCSNSLWRISNHSDLGGVGGEKADGRWHTAAPGKRIVYLSEHPAVALVETLANLKGNPALLPERFQLIRIQADDELLAGMTGLTDPKGKAFDGDTPLDATRQAGDRWLKSKASALVSVPSFPSPRSMNILLNPLHPDAAKVIVLESSWLRYDKRLFHIHAGSK